MFSVPGSSRLSGTQSPAHVPSAEQIRNVPASMGSVSARDTAPPKYPEIAKLSPRSFPMLAKAEHAPKPKHFTSLSLPRRTRWEGLPKLVIVPKELMLEPSFKLLPAEPGGRDSIHLQFDGNALTVRNMKETVSGVTLNGTFEYDESVREAINQYKSHIQAEIHPPLTMLIGIPADQPQVYAPLNLGVDSEAADSKTQQLYAARGNDDGPPRQPHGAAAGVGNRRLMLRPAIAGRPSGMQHQATASATHDPDWSQPIKIGRWEKRVLLPPDWYGSAPPNLRQSVNWAKVQRQMGVERLMNVDADTDARQAGGFSFDPPPHLEKKQSEHVLFAQTRPEDIYGIAKSVLTSLEEQPQECLVNDLKKIQSHLRNFNNAKLTKDQRRREECESSLRQCVSDFLNGCESSDLLGLQRCSSFIPNLTEFAEWDYFQAFAVATVELHKNLESARQKTRIHFAPSESGDTAHQMAMETATTEAQ